MANKAAANKAKNAGNVNFKNGKYEEALKNYDDAVRFDPEEVIYLKSQSIIATYWSSETSTIWSKIVPYFAAASDFHTRT